MKRHLFTLALAALPLWPLGTSAQTSIGLQNHNLVSNFAVPALRDLTLVTTLFSRASSLFGVNNFADVQTLSRVTALAGTPAANNLLILSLDSRRLIELDRTTGTVLSSLDLAGFTQQAIEGLTVDALGNIDLVAEDSGTPNSRLFVLSAVPEPGSWALMLAGMAALGWRLRRA